MMNSAPSSGAPPSVSKPARKTMTALRGWSTWNNPGFGQSKGVAIMFNWKFDQIDKKKISGFQKRICNDDVKQRWHNKVQLWGQPMWCLWWQWFFIVITINLCRKLFGCSLWQLESERWSWNFIQFLILYAADTFWGMQALILFPYLNPVTKKHPVSIGLIT